jgi:hypothetical protein
VTKIPTMKRFSQIGRDRSLRYTGHLMRTVVALFVATVSLLAPVAPTAATPPEDVAAFCRATYPQLPFQIRCLNVENAAAERVSRAAAGADRETFNGCLGVSPSWAAMESCLAQSARGGSTGAAPGLAGAAPSPGAEPGAEGAGPGAPPPGPREAAAAPPPATPGAPGAPGGPPSSTVVLGPQAGVPAAAPVENRPTRTITEADAERHLRGVLERTGNPAAQCTKKQYGPGWVIICE